MPDPVPGGQAQQREVPARVLSRIQRAVLGLLMSLAVIVLERRIRKALRPGAGQQPRMVPEPGTESRPGAGTM